MFSYGQIATCCVTITFSKPSSSFFQQRNKGQDPWPFTRMVTKRKGGACEVLGKNSLYTFSCIGFNLAYVNRMFFASDYNDFGLSRILPQQIRTDSLEVFFDWGLMAVGLWGKAPAHCWSPLLRKGGCRIKVLQASVDVKSRHSSAPCSSQGAFSVLSQKRKTPASPLTCTLTKPSNITLCEAQGVEKGPYLYLSVQTPVITREVKYWVIII